MISIIEINMIYLIMLIMASVVMLYIYIRIVYDVFMGGGMEICEDFILFNKISSMEMLSVVGVLMGVSIGVMMMI